MEIQENSTRNRESEAPPLPEKKVAQAGEENTQTCGKDGSSQCLLAPVTEPRPAGPPRTHPFTAGRGPVLLDPPPEPTRMRREYNMGRPLEKGDCWAWFDNRGTDL
jgi:hypothetical protein